MMEEKRAGKEYDDTLIVIFLAGSFLPAAPPLGMAEKFRIATSWLSADTINYSKFIPNSFTLEN